MALEAIDLNAIRDRLMLLGIYNTVSDVESAAAAMETPAKPPAAFVAVSRETANANRTQAVHEQAISTNIAALICLGAERADDLRRDQVETSRLAVIESLIGWTPPGATKALDYVGYQVLAMGQGLIWVEVTFVTGWRLRK